jgi:uncharacterized metal-binding protein YceD (DUF177 family)
VSGGPVFSRHVAAQDVPDRGTHVVLDADEAQRAEIARHLGIPEVLSFNAQLHVTPFRRSGLAVRGTVEAEIVQVCGVSLEPFPTKVVEAVDATFVPESDLPTPDDAPGAEHEADLNAPEALENGGVDVGMLAVEHLALGMDPYPRSPDAGEPKVEEASSTETHKPFAGLQSLLTKGADKSG